MKKSEKSLPGPVRFVVRTLLRFWYVWAAIALLLVAAFWLRGCRDEMMRKGALKVAVKHTDSIDATPQEVRAVREIGQWELLSIRTEELVELSRKGILRDKRIARIYPGTLRIGIDMDRAAPDWFERRGDTAVLRLPRPALLDTNFIDETRVRPLYESGTWEAAAREQLYRKARRQMMERTLTRQNIVTAEQTATSYFTDLLRGLGFDTVMVSYR